MLSWLNLKWDENIVLSIWARHEMVQKMLDNYCVPMLPSKDELDRLRQNSEQKKYLGFHKRIEIYQKKRAKNTW